MNLDLINGIFEFLMSVVIFYSCWQLYKDKEIKGIHVSIVVLPLIWGIFRLFYYPSLDQTYSLFATSLVVSANLLYITLILYYGKFYHGN